MYNIPRSRDWILLLRRAFLLLSRTPGTNSLKSRRPSLTRGKMLIIARSNLPSLLSLSLSLSLPFPRAVNKRGISKMQRLLAAVILSRCDERESLRGIPIIPKIRSRQEGRDESLSTDWIAHRLTSNETLSNENKKTDSTPRYLRVIFPADCNRWAKAIRVSANFFPVTGDILRWEIRVTCKAL